MATSKIAGHYDTKFSAIAFTIPSKTAFLWSFANYGEPTEALTYEIHFFHVMMSSMFLYKNKCFDAMITAMAEAIEAEKGAET